MAQKSAHGTLRCLFCGKPFRNLGTLTAHLDIGHRGWVCRVMSRIGLPSTQEYPIFEYRRALAEALVHKQLRAPGK